MSWLFEDRMNVRLLHDAPRIHDRDSRAHTRYHPKIMSDKKDGGRQIFLKITQQLQDLGLDGHIESRGGFVSDQEVGSTRNGHGDHRALLHPTAELVRVLSDSTRRRRDMNEFEHLNYFTDEWRPCHPLVEP